MLRSLMPVFLLGISCLAATAADKPNVVIVITDDQGHGDLSCHGNPILKTPHIDQLFSESVCLTDYHVAPTCSPTRSAFLTGHWTNRTGVWHTIMGRSMLREDEVTLGQIFKDNGYATGMFGKWHLGDNYPYRPEDRGFTEVMRHGGGGVGQTPDYWNNAYFDGSYWHNGTPEVVERLRKFYEKWWAELEPTFDKATAIALGHPADNPTRLTSHDWITTEMTPWNQSQVRAAMTGEENTGFWNVNVASAGKYEVRLRRWPEEADAAIDASLPGGEPVPGVAAYRTTPGKAIQPNKATLQIGDQSVSSEVHAGDKQVTFEMVLPAGRTTMSAVFETADGAKYGAYFAYVTKK